MSLVTLNINGSRYEIGCQDGQEEQVLALASELDRKVQSLAKATGASGEGILLVLTGLTLADEVRDARAAATEAQAALQTAQSEMQALQHSVRTEFQGAMDSAVAETRQALDVAQGERAAAVAEADKLWREKAVLESQLDEARTALEAAHARLQQRRDAQTLSREHEEEMAKAIEALATRIETVAQSLLPA